MISKSELDDRLEQKLAAAEPLTSEIVSDMLRDHIAFGLEHFDELDDEAKKSIDDAFKSVLKSAERATRALEDGPVKRERLRAIARAQGDHFSVTNVFRSLSESPADLDAYLTATETSVLAILQDAGDVMHDARVQSPRGREVFLVAALLAGAVDDSLCALLLMRRGLATQVATLLRAAQEKAELVELFLEKPEHVDVWMDEARRWKELKPGRVRALLGRSDDIRYKYLSEAGAHPTFMSIKQRAALHLPNSEGEGIPHLRIWVGGQRLPWALIPLCVGAIGQAALTLALSIKWMEQKQGVPENRERLERADRLFLEFKRDHAVPKLREIGMLETDLDELLDDGDTPGNEG